MIIVGGLEFSTKKSLEDFVRKIVTETGPNQNIPEKHRSFFESLIERHPEWLSKVGVGVRDFKVIANPVNPKALGLMIIRKDGSEIDISWRTCVSGNSSSVIQNLKSAMRQAVGMQIMEFRNQALAEKPVCFRCNCEIADRGHVDHDVPFESLVSDFLKANNEHPTKFRASPEANMAIFRSEDLAFEKEWAQFHKANAKLVLTCAKCNLTRKKSLP